MAVNAFLKVSHDNYLIPLVGKGGYLFLWVSHEFLYWEYSHVAVEETGKMLIIH